MKDLEPENSNEDYDSIIFNLSWSETRAKNDIELYTGAMLLRDHEWIMSEFNHECSLRCILAYICCFPLTILKIIIFIFKQIQKPWPENK